MGDRQLKITYRQISLLSSLWEKAERMCLLIYTVFFVEICFFLFLAIWFLAAHSTINHAIEML